MKKIQLSLTVVILSIGAALVQADPITATNYFILPNPMFAASAHPIDDFFVTIWAGDFTDGYGPGDVDQSSIFVNGSLVPASVEIAEHAIFGGDALKISVSITEFLPPYGLLWDTQTLTYTVAGSFNDETLFTIEGTFTAIGHTTSGDVNSDGRVNVSDLNFMIADIFRGGPSPAILQTGDVDGSCGAPNLQDLNYMVNFIFRGGSAPTHCTQ